MKKQKTFIDIVAVLYIILFMYTGVYKLIAHHEFAMQLIKHHLLKHFYVYVSWAVPIIEIAASLLLIFSRTRIIGLWVSMTTMISFTVYLIIMMATSPSLPCSCGGIMSKLSWGQHIAVNTAYILLAAFAIFFRKKIFSPKQRLNLATQ
jgi:hypothetical protein